MTATRAFLTEYFEDAYQDARKKRREVVDRGVLLIAHLIRTELPTATAITVNGSVMTTVRHGDKILWKFNDPATSGKLLPGTRDAIRNTLLDMRTFYRLDELLAAADWQPVRDLLGSFLVPLPADPDKDQAPAGSNGQPVTRG
ncbi:hypothetical protein HTV80_31235 [Streptomyces sp. Vc74B-19]|uniref:hypothetical protein n=1 Tax=Streptomyces sp. Vc74B-19 TaxID=2741324 RepID=UPI001BFC4433|nr:hypothetical protein [Streptomyces sp. Vc74B-19]MBT3167530.1 hypothetical protein [Streptomyces sp. Vc74B-19]